MQGEWRVTAPSPIAGVDDAARSGAASPIEPLAAKVQRLPAEVRWLYSQPDLIRARALGVPLRPGRWTRRASRLLGAARRVGCAEIVVLGAALALALRLWLRPAASVRPSAGRLALFVGIGALGETRLRAALARLAPAAGLVCVDETDPTSLLALHRPNLAGLLATWRSTAKAIGPHLRRSAIAEFEPADLQVWAALRLGDYVFFRAWFRSFVAAHEVELIAMSAASHVAFAAVGCGPAVIYMPHGFIRRSLVFPDFPEVHVTNRSEARHVQARLGGAAVRRLTTPPMPIQTDRIALVAGHYGTIAELERAGGFLDWARRRAYPVVVRPHPRDRTGYWDRWRDVEGVTFEDAVEPFDATLRRLAPRLVVTWGSTTLLDALVHGATPVTLADATARDADLVFPFEEIALAWPADELRIGKLAEDRAGAAKMARALGANVLFDGA